MKLLGVRACIRIRELLENYYVYVSAKWYFCTFFFWRVHKSGHLVCERQCKPFFEFILAPRRWQVLLHGASPPLFEGGPEGEGEALWCFTFTSLWCFTFTLASVNTVSCYAIYMISSSLNRWHRLLAYSDVPRRSSAHVMHPKINSDCPRVKILSLPYCALGAAKLLSWGMVSCFSAQGKRNEDVVRCADLPN